MCNCSGIISREQLLHEPDNPGFSPVDVLPRVPRKGGLLFVRLANSQSHNSLKQRIGAELFV